MSKRPVAAADARSFRGGLFSAPNRGTSVRVARGLVGSLLGSLIASLISTIGLAQHAPTCRPPDEGGKRFLQYFTIIATSNDSSHVQRRRAIAVPAVTANEISLVQDDNICSRLVPRYEAETLRRDAKTGVVIPGSGRLYVVQAGPVYLSTDPSKTMGEWGLLLVFDDKWRVLYRGLY